MAATCISEQAECFINLGRLEEAAAAYEESIRRSERLGDVRGVAMDKGQLGTVRMEQHRYAEALAAHAEARERFTKLAEPIMVSVSWHLTGMAYQKAGQSEAAEDAYRKALALKVRLGDAAGQASTLTQLGNLYKDVLGRLEEAAAFYQQAVDKSVESGDTAKEGLRRNNLADTLRRLRRLDEARKEVHRAIKCREGLGHAGSVWSAWANLANIETDDGNPAAAAEANRKTIACYLAYRRGGRKNHSDLGRISFAVTQSLLAGDDASAAFVSRPASSSS